MKIAFCLVILLFASTAAAGPWDVVAEIPTVEHQLYMQQMQLLRDMTAPYTVLPSSPYGGTIIDNTGYMTPYLFLPSGSSGPSFHFDSRGRMRTTINFGNGISVDLD